MVTALADTVAVGLAPGAGGQARAITPGTISTAGWTRPAIGPITSRFGPRVHPLTGVVRLHAGTDIGALMDAPIYAAAAGTLVRAKPASGYGNLIVIDHGGGLVTRYAHMYRHGILVAVGDQVPAGRQIGLVGSAGGSTSPHVHDESQAAGQFINPNRS